MSMLARKVAEREKGEAPLSIGTSMALESLGVLVSLYQTHRLFIGTMKSGLI